MKMKLLNQPVMMKLPRTWASTNTLLYRVVVGWWRNDHPRYLSSDVISTVHRTEVISILKVDTRTQLVEHSD